MSNRRSLASPHASPVCSSYSRYFGVSDPAGILINHPLSQQTIAEGVGSIRRSVAGLMAQWRHEGIVTKRRGRVLLTNVQRLSEIAGTLLDSICYQSGMPLDHLPGTERKLSVRLEVVAGQGSMPGRSVEVGAAVVGRSEACTLPMADELVSPQHCRVFLAATGGRYWVEDLESDNGTLLNGKSIQRAVLKDGDLVQIGASRIVVHID